MTPQPNKFTISKSRHLLKTTSKAPNKENTLYTEFNSYPQTWINQRNVPQKKITRLIKVEKKKNHNLQRKKKKRENNDYPVSAHGLEALICRTLGAEGRVSTEN